jgi:hypothetical protein
MLKNNFYFILFFVKFKIWKHILNKNAIKQVKCNTSWHYQGMKRNQNIEGHKIYFKLFQKREIFQFGNIEIESGIFFSP